MVAEIRPYTSRPMGRPLTRPRPKQGARLAALRMAAGLSQAELGRAIGETQQNIAFWELSSKPPRSDVLSKLAKVLDVTVETLLGEDAEPRRSRRPGPVSKVQRALEQIRSLPKSKQDLVVQFVETLVEQHRKAG